MPDLRLLMAILCLPLFSLSQNIADGSAVSTDIRRVQLNEDIDRIQKNLSSIPPKRIDSLQSWLESNPALDHRLKYKYLSGIRYLLEDLVAGKVSMINADNLIDAYHQLMENDIGGISIESAVKKYTYEINRSLLSERTVFYENTGLSRAKIFLYSQHLDHHPDQILTTIAGYLSEDFVDDALSKAANLYPSEFYNYSSAIQTPLAK
ncbi:MAG: hypothetical protein EBU73_09380, partial [Chitinophagia bacterium]|nr:hypothetical protein [Chitinophagia bacterium]